MVYGAPVDKPKFFSFNRRMIPCIGDWAIYCREKRISKTLAAASSNPNFFFYQLNQL